jgi:hypothetical protein
MTIGGVPVSEAQFLGMDKIQKAGKLSILQLHARTGSALVTKGFAEYFVPDATNYAMAARGRVRYYRLTKAGVEAINGLKKLYDRK